jgi:hypothetical protein
MIEYSRCNIIYYDNMIDQFQIHPLKPSAQSGQKPKWVINRWCSLKETQIIKKKKKKKKKGQWN